MPSIQTEDMGVGNYNKSLNESLHATHASPSRQRQRGCSNIDPYAVLRDLIHYKFEHFDEPKPVKVIMQDGVWMVPENERPKNWREMK